MVTVRNQQMGFTEPSIEASLNVFYPDGPRREPFFLHWGVELTPAGDIAIRQALFNNSGEEIQQIATQ